MPGLRHQLQVTLEMGEGAVALRGLRMQEISQIQMGDGILRTARENPVVEHRRLFVALFEDFDHGQSVQNPNMGRQVFKIMLQIVQAALFLQHGEAGSHGFSEGGRRSAAAQFKEQHGAFFSERQPLILQLESLLFPAALRQIIDCRCQRGAGLRETFDHGTRRRATAPYRSWFHDEARRPFSFLPGQHLPADQLPAANPQQTQRASRGAKNLL